MSRISENLKKAREKNGLSQKQLAKKLGTSESFINDVENGRRVMNDSMIARLSKLFNIEMDDINMYSEEQASLPKEEVRPKKKEEVSEVWSDAFGSVVKEVPVYSYDLKNVLDRKLMPILSNKIQGHSIDKVAFIEIENDELSGFRLCKNDRAFAVLSHEMTGSGFYLLERGGERILRQVKKLDAANVLLIKSSGRLVTETVSLKELKLLAKLLYAEIQL